MELLMRKSLLMIGMTMALLTACQRPVPPSDFRQPEPSEGLTASGVTEEVPSEAMTETPESLEVGDAPTVPTEIRAGTGSIFIGSADAELTLTIYEDYGCFYCREFASTEMPWLLKEFVADKKLMIERVFVPMSPAGMLMAKASLCSQKQNLFELADQTLHARPITTDAQLATLAKSVKMNLKNLQTCMASKATALSLEAATARAKAAGVSRLPSFELGTDRWIGILTREELESKIGNAD